MVDLSQEWLERRLSVRIRLPDEMRLSNRRDFPRIQDAIYCDWGMELRGGGEDRRCMRKE